MIPAFMLVILAGLIWLRTGRDPIYWLIKLLTALRACIALMARIVSEAHLEFRERYPDEYERNKKEVSA